MNETQLPAQEISTHVLQEKYCRGNEKTIEEVQTRVAEALASAEQNADQEHWEKQFLEAMRCGFVPGGRIMASAGVDTGATMINCFVQPIYDSMTTSNETRPGIMEALAQSAETMRRGGGVGYDFSPIRPRGALVRGTGSRASGPVSYMRIFNEMCATIESAGARRGAQMAILRCDHPDILEFVSCKDRPGEMTNFNISVAVTDRFMRAVESDEYVSLVHESEPSEDRRTDFTCYSETTEKWRYDSLNAKELWREIIHSTYDHAEPGVYFIDSANEENNLKYTEYLASTNPCGEQPLPPYGCCDLGSINLTKLITNPFTPEANIDDPQLRKLVGVAVRMLDNVLDITAWPLREQYLEANKKRRIGLGIMGLGDALLMLGLAYDSVEGRLKAAEIMEVIRNTAYRTSAMLAEEKGSFRVLHPSEYLDRPFIKRLPDSVQELIRKKGIRNSHLLSIAPTGTIALAFGDNVSSGIEPPYSWKYRRRKRMLDGSHREFDVEDYAHRLYHALRSEPETTPDITVAWKTALEIAPKDHMAMSAVLQPFVDSAISKTVNVPEDCSFANFENLYTQAWENGLKGLTTYRPNKVTGSVLSQAPSEAPKPAPKVVETATSSTSASDRRVALETAPEPALASLRWQRRPLSVGGNMSWTYLVQHPLGKFAVFIGEIKDQTNHLVPFECWVNGEEVPRGIGALAKSLSMDMRSEDSVWLAKKLDALAEMASDDAFDMSMPPDGRKARMPSLVAGFARLVRHRCKDLNAFRSGGPTPVVDALFYSAADAPGPDGTMSWTVEIENPNTRDQITLGVKELELPNGVRRPYEIWLSGQYPRALDGLCRSLSLDMRIIDPAWIGAKLRQIVDFHEPLGDFRAREPGTDKSRLYRSTVAYIARLVIHRYAMLGILDEQGMPVEAMGVMHVVGDETAQEAHSVGAAEVATILGKSCPECRSYSLIRKDGCDFCTDCGYIGECG